MQDQQTAKARKQSNTKGLMKKQDLDTDTDICACTMVGLDYWTYHTTQVH